MEIPKWLKSDFNVKDVNAFEKIIEDSEKKTSAEIIPIIVKRSTPIHIPILVSVLYAALFQYLLAVFGASEASWDEHSVLWEYLSFPVCFVLFFALQKYLASAFRLLCPKYFRDFYARARAEIEFCRLGIKNTEGATGVLVFFSMEEHIAVILADKSIAEHVESGFWTDTLKESLEKASKEGLPEALRFAVNRVADLLSKDFPRADDDVNELKDVLIIKE